MIGNIRKLKLYKKTTVFFAHLYLSLSEHLLYNINVSFLSYTLEDTSLIYGYARISSKHQNIDHQIRNIKSRYPDAIMIIEVYTGRTQDRPKWVNLISMVKENDKIVFDSVSRMSRTSDERICKTIKRSISGALALEFINEPQIGYCCVPRISSD